jgi:hypothetical protein
MDLNQMYLHSIKKEVCLCSVKFTFMDFQTQMVTINDMS